MYHRQRARPPGPACQGAGWQRGPNARSRVPPAGPHAGQPRASSAGTRPQPGPGGFGRVSPRLGGARLGPGWGPNCPCGVAPSGACSPAPGLRHPLPWPGPGGFGRVSPRLAFRAPAPPCVRPWRTPRYCQAAYCDSDEGVRPVGHSQRASPGTAAPAERHLQVTRRPPLASRPGPVSTRWHTGARIRTPHGRPPARAWLCRCAELAPWPPPEALPPCALRADPTRLPHTICSGTMRACENGGPPPLPFSGGKERPPPLPKWEGRREASSSSPPVFGRGGASGAQASGPRPRLGSRLGAAHLRTGGEEECTGTADTNPGCNYLVRGYSPSMHYFSSPLPFQRGARGSLDPLRRAPSTSAGQIGAPAGAGLRRSPNPRGWRAVYLGRPERGSRGRGPRRSRGRRGRARPPFRQGWHPWPAPGSGHPCRRGASQAQPAQPKCGGA